MSVRRIAYIVNAFPKLSETFVAGELAELRRRNIVVQICSLNRSDESVQHDIVTRAQLIDRTVWNESTFYRQLSDFRPQLVHAHFATEPTRVARELAASLRVPYTFTAHGYDVFRKPPNDFTERAKGAAAVVTVSQENANYIAEQFGVDSQRIHVIPCGIDTTMFRPATVEDTESVVVCVARLAPVKNLTLLLDACKLLRDRGLAFRCVIVGEGRCRQELEQHIRRLKLQAIVCLVGALTQNDVMKWWQRATVGVLTSRSEGMPVCLMEAAACAVPVVSTAVGGVPELIAHGQTGLLAKQNAESIAECLSKLISDKALASHMGRAARQRAVNRFSVERQVDELITLWNDICRTG